MNKGTEGNRTSARGRGKVRKAIKVEKNSKRGNQGQQIREKKNENRVTIVKVIADI